MENKQTLNQGNTAMIEYYLVSDNGGSEYLRKYSYAGNLMTFTRNREEAVRTTDRADATKWAKIARELYDRKRFKAIYVCE